jgi:uncharacterized repeat protein (TIGR01451 family)
MRREIWEFALTTLLVVLSTNAAFAQDRDLTVTIQQTTPDPVVTGRPVNYKVTIRNMRSGNAANVLVHVKFNLLFQSIEPTPAAGSGFICSVSGPVRESDGRTSKLVSCSTSLLAGGAEESVNITARVPSREMQSTITALVDPNNTVDEANEENNGATITTSSVEIADLDPDLTGSTLEASPGSEVFYDVKVKNVDDKTAANVFVRSTLPQQVDFVRTESNLFTSCSRSAQDLNCFAASIAPDQTVSIRIVGRVLPLVSAGSMIYFGVTVDPNNALPERNEQNNTAFVVTTVRAMFDLRITGTITNKDLPHLWLSNNPEGKLVTLNFQIRNNGPGTSPATVVRIAWPHGFSDPDNLCPIGTHLDEYSCIDGNIYPDFDNHFDSRSIPVLVPGGVADRSVVAFRKNRTGLFDFLVTEIFFMTAEIDLDNPAADTNSNNNRVIVTFQLL